MDKHDRPYKCPAEGCEKLPGFTYSGGLLRHEREVHNKHGGPRKQLNCPHQNCKRHTGKGFSRQENLNEHLRRVHTDTSALEEAGMNGMSQEQQAVQDLSEGGEPGAKRKRRSTGGAGQSVEDELREENKKLRLECENLKRAHADLIRQISQITGQNHSYLNNLADPQMQQQATMQVQQQQAPMAAMQPQMQQQNQLSQNNLQQQQQMPQSQMPQSQMQQPQMQQPQMQQPQMQQLQQAQQAHQQQQQMPQPPSAQQIVQQIASQQQAQQAAQQAATHQAQQQVQAQQQAAQVQQALPQRMPSAPMM